MRSQIGFRNGLRSRIVEVIIVFSWVVGLSSTTVATEPLPQEVFERRIMPIFKSPNPSSSVQCHLKDVDLKDYILPNAEDTFRSLRNQGLIDLETPEKSKIVQLIEMGSTPEAKVSPIHAKVRQAEREAFLAWIRACAEDPALRIPRQPETPHTSEVTLLVSADPLQARFENTIWAMRFRCMNCHSEGTPQNIKLVKKHGPQVAWFKKDGPAATLDYLRESKLLDAKSPEQSLLLLKPLNKVEHGGGKKFEVGDQGYKAFRSFLEDFATVTNGGKLAGTDEAPRRFGTDVWLKLTGTPKEWKGKLLQVNIHAWDVRKRAWEDAPCATSDRAVGDGLWQHNLTLLAPSGSARAKGWETGKPSLPEGNYQVRVYVDVSGRIAEDWRAKPRPEDYVGQSEVRSRWPEGYGRMTTLPASRFRK